jgi:DNA-directed RNA polymerase specialized sigma24 family protein
MTEILQEAKQGSTERLGEIMMAAYPLLRHQVRRLLPAKFKGKARTSDVVQDAFTLAVRHLGAFRGKTAGEFHGWLLAIVGRAGFLVVRHWSHSK